jgi:hypothetical protein
METKYEKAIKLSEKKFKLLIGVKKQTFHKMVEKLQVAYTEKHKQGGRKSKLSIELMLMMALEYWRQYITFFELAFNYGVAESTAHDIVVWVENVLVKCGTFSLPGKKALLEDKSLEIVLLDVMESPVERPKNKKNK